MLVGVHGGWGLCGNPRGGPPVSWRGTMAEGERRVETSAGVLAVVRSVMLVKMKTFVRVVSFKTFKPSHPHYSWLQRFRQIAATHDKTLPDFMRDVIKSEGLYGVLKRAMPAYMANSVSSMTLYSVYSELTPRTRSRDVACIQAILAPTISQSNGLRTRTRTRTRTCITSSRSCLLPPP
eukprot:375683-Hanusia_phi.AAC.1